MTPVKPRILIVEDEKNWLEMHEFFLGQENLNLDVKATDNLHQALRDMDKFDCVLVDGLGGLWEKFAEKGRDKGIRVIVISSKQEKEEASFREQVASYRAEFLNKDVFIFGDGAKEYRSLAERINGSGGINKEALSF